MCGESLEQLAPILAQNSAATLPVFPRTIVGPWVDFEVAFTFGAAVPKKLTRPPALEISATPNTETPHLRKLQRTIDPTAATPFRRSHIPVRMVIERDDNHRLAEAPNPECGQVMKIAGAVEQKWRKPRFELARSADIAIGPAGSSAARR